MKSINFAKKTAVLSAGDEVDRVYIVRDGEIKMSLPADKRYPKLSFH